MSPDESPYRFVEQVLTSLECAVIKRESEIPFSVATILEGSGDLDSVKEWTEPVYDADGTHGPIPRLATRLPFYFNAAVIAAALLVQRTPTPDEVGALVVRCFTEQTKDMESDEAETAPSALDGCLYHLRVAELLARWTYRPETKPSGEVAGIEMLYRFLAGSTDPEGDYGPLAKTLVLRLATYYLED